MSNFFLMRNWTLQYPIPIKEKMSLTSDQRYAPKFLLDHRGDVVAIPYGRMVQKMWGVTATNDLQDQFIPFKTLSLES